MNIDPRISGKKHTATVMKNGKPTTVKLNAPKQAFGKKYVPPKPPA